MILNIILQNIFMELTSERRSHAQGWSFDNPPWKICLMMRRMHALYEAIYMQQREVIPINIDKCGASYVIAVALVKKTLA